MKLTKGKHEGLVACFGPWVAICEPTHYIVAKKNMVFFSTYCFVCEPLHGYLPVGLYPVPSVPICTRLGHMVPV